MEYQSLIQWMTSNKTLLAKKVMMTPLFLVSVSLFSFVFSNSCSWPWWWHSFLYPFIKFYFSSLPMQVLSHALDKTWIFLICNGIVVVIGIANTSSIKSVQYNNSPSPPLDAKAVTYHDDSVLELLPEQGNAVCELLEENEKENDIAAATEVEEEGREEEGEGNQESEIIYCIAGDDDGELENEEEEEDDQSETCFMITKEEEEDEEDQEQVYDYDHYHEYEYEGGEGGGEGMDKLSTEELNKKFEDFIRKMKEELRIQLVQQQQLILSC